MPTFDPNYIIILEKCLLEVLFTVLFPQTLAAPEDPPSTIQPDYRKTTSITESVVSFNEMASVINEDKTTAVQLKSSSGREEVQVGLEYGV